MMSTDSPKTEEQFYHPIATFWLSMIPYAKRAVQDNSEKPSAVSKSYRSELLWEDMVSTVCRAQRPENG